ncbi:TetR/AcrR family transcriptional regulator [Nocardia arizonensis]|uniref:TetR/AcrR family transcriptional regulator n=1 Tax=Nocardia arizonensis TaxID=1141647 RepID=UPI0006D138A2|nr:TetR/AcrR family transcriptional regulator [Nocardia arizonensis]
MTRRGTTGKNVATSQKPNRESPYHHGDLRNALVRAAAALAENGGPEAVTVRAAARRVGVTPTAAYRHFANHDQLLAAAHEQAQRTLFDAISESIATLEPDAHPMRKLDAAGRGYITFAMREPGLFRTAFCVTETTADVTETTHGDQGYLDAPAFTLLTDLLDEMVAIGYTDPADRPEAELGAWSTVHGMAWLIIDGALGHLDDGRREVMVQHVIDLVRRGLGTGPAAASYLGGPH